MKAFFGIFLTGLILATSAPPAAEAQGRFSPAFTVDDALVTRYQLDQRTLFLSLLGASGDPRELAREQLSLIHI